MLADPSKVPNDLLVPYYLIHSAIYYVYNTSIITDAEYDKLARQLYDSWDTVEHYHKNLIEKEALLSGGSYIKFPLIVLNTAKGVIDSKKPVSFLTPEEQKQSKKISRKKKLAAV